jgi:hypothetical protein
MIVDAYNIVLVPEGGIREGQDPIQYERWLDDVHHLTGFSMNIIRNNTILVMLGSLVSVTHGPMIERRGTLMSIVEAGTEKAFALIEIDPDVLVSVPFKHITIPSIPADHLR